MMPRAHRNPITAALGIVTLGILVLGGCRSKEPPSEARRHAGAQLSPPVASAPTQPAPAAAAHSVSTPTSASERGHPTTTTAAAVEPLPDPGGCMIPGCHENLGRVAYRHGPLVAGGCEVCHEPEQEGHKFPLRSSSQELCVSCHQVTGHRPYVHAAVGQQGCLSCHKPHGSDTKFLLIDASAELTCRRCHVIERNRYLHGPFASGQCTACHQPHESDNKFLLIGGEGSQHCLTCHKNKRQEVSAEGGVHKPMEEGCTRCHDPHSSEYKNDLKAPIDGLCFQCHEDIKATVSAASTPHGALVAGESCANCHDSHFRRGRFMLRNELENLCLSCHDKPQTTNDGHTIPDMRPVLTNRQFLHGPVRSGQCDACHEVHGSARLKLLRKRFPQEFYEAFDLAEYELCFDCHSSALVLDKETTTLTNFRDGERNLHFVHVNRSDKGRTCRTCHEIHGSNLPRHMATTVPFEGGGWPMPIRFERFDDGGGCGPGCHEPKKYRRSGAASQPVRAAPTDAEEKVNP